MTLAIVQTCHSAELAADLVERDAPRGQVRVQTADGPRPAGSGDGKKTAFFYYANITVYLCMKNTY